MDSYIPRVKVSIITVAHNAVDTIEQTILSVLNQTYGDIEYIVVDGGSNDGTRDIIMRYDDRIAIWVSEKDDGISDAFNKGIKLSSGDMIGILNADDWYEKDAVESVVSNYSDDIDIYCGSLGLIDKSGQMFKIMKSKLWLMDYGMHIMHPTAFIKKRCYDSCGYFDTSLMVTMDYEIMLRFILKGCKIKVLNKVLAFMRIEGVSSNIEKAYKEELIVKQKYLSKTKYLISYMFNRINYYRIKYII